MILVFTLKSAEGDILELKKSIHYQISVCVFNFFSRSTLGRGGTIGISRGGLRGARGGRFLRGRGTRGLMQGRGTGRGAVRGRGFIQNQGRGEMKAFRLIQLVIHFNYEL